MWLSLDERRLLAGYFRTLGEVGKEGTFHEDAIACLLHGKTSIPAPGQESENSDKQMEHSKIKKAIHQLILDRKRVPAANRLLAARSLINLSHHQQDSNTVILSLTLDGYDLGRRYSNWLTRTHLWFREYKDHWMWLIVAFIGGSVGAKLIDFLVSRFKAP
jgi:hypothetical protein